MGKSVLYWQTLRRAGRSAFQLKNLNIVCTKEREDMRCQHCSEELVEGKRFCSSCGQKVETEELSTKPRHCGDCGAVLDVGKDFCGECGGKVSGGASRLSSPEKPPQQVKTESQDNEVIKEFKFYRLGYRGRGGLGGPFGMKNFCTFATVMTSLLRLSVCRTTTLAGDPVKPVVREYRYEDIDSIELKKKISFDWVFYTTFCTVGGFANPIFFLFAFVAFFNIFGRKVTIKPKYGKIFVIKAEGKDAEEFVELVVNELRKNG